MFRPNRTTARNFQFGQPWRYTWCLDAWLGMGKIIGRSRALPTLARTQPKRQPFFARFVLQEAVSEFREPCASDGTECASRNECCSDVCFEGLCGEPRDRFRRRSTKGKNTAVKQVLHTTVDASHNRPRPRRSPHDRSFLQCGYRSPRPQPT